MNSILLAMHCKTPDHPNTAIARYVTELFEASKRLRKLHETECNRTLTSKEQQKIEFLRIHARKYAQFLGIEIRFNGDPRGSAIKIPGGIPGGVNDLGGDFPLCD